MLQSFPVKAEVHANGHVLTDQLTGEFVYALFEEKLAVGMFV